MINRRLLRIDVFQVLYELVCHAQSAAGQPDPVAPTANEGDVAVVQATPELLRRGEQRLGEAMQAYIELTHLLLELPLEFQRANARLLALREKRMLSTEEDRSLSTNLQDNRLLRQIRGDQRHADFLKIHRLDWQREPDLLRVLYKHLETTDFHLAYQRLAQPDYAADRQYLLDCYEWLFDQDDLYEWAETHSGYYLTNLDSALSEVHDAIDGLRPSDGAEWSILESSIRADLTDFAQTLLRETLEGYQANRAIIEKHLLHWTWARVAQCDLLLLELALCEAQVFSSIPISVTINEYIELAKLFGTPQSSRFVNGILDKMLNSLLSRGLIQKEEHVRREGTCA